MSEGVIIYAVSCLFALIISAAVIYYQYRKEEDFHITDELIISVGVAVIVWPLTILMCIVAFIIFWITEMRNKNKQYGG